mmetsp:Transcript_31163/g.58471  ORF Transcript_31163/g.58471 Transcript_31163/m.58471 type:complete len:138 (+) Transcript_31163:69-482(+)
MFFGCGCCTSATSEQEASFRPPLLPGDGEVSGDGEKHGRGAVKEISIPELSPEPTDQGQSNGLNGSKTVGVTFAGETVQEVPSPLHGRRTDLAARKATGALKMQDLPSDDDSEDEKNPEDAPKRTSLSRKGTAYVRG